MADKNCISPVIGIDIGTTFSRVAVYYKDKIQKVKDELGNVSTPSVISFTPTKILVGNDAVQYSLVDPKNTVFDLKRLLGSNFSDVKDNKEIWPFHVVSDENNKTLIEVEYKTKKVQYSPEEITAILIMKMKEAAEAQIDMEIRNAVLTVPVGFSQSQRVSIRNSAILAGLNVLQLLNESTAAAIRILSTNSLDEISLIFNLGGGVLNVAIVESNDLGYCNTVLASTGDVHLGGEDFDNRLVDFFCQESGFDRKCYDDRPLYRLNDACSRAKCSLSRSTSACLSVLSLYTDDDYTNEITRARFEDLTSDLFTSVIDSVKSVFLKSNLKKENISHILILGGSSKIPKLRTMLMELFAKARISYGTDYDIACGAALHAARIIQHNKTTECGSPPKEYKTTDIMTTSIGIGSSSSILTLIPRGTHIPYSIEYEVSVSEGELSFANCIYEGNNLMNTDELSFNVEDETTLKQDKVEKIEEKSSAPSICNFKVTFAVDTSGILKISPVATVMTNTSTEDNMVVRLKNKRKMETEMNDMCMNMKRFKCDDEEQKKRVAVEMAAFHIKKMIKQSKVESDDISEELKRIDDKCNEMIKWIDETRVRYDPSDINELIKKEKELSTAKEFILKLTTQNQKE